MSVLLLAVVCTTIEIEIVIKAKRSATSTFKGLLAEAAISLQHAANPLLRCPQLAEV